MRNKGILNPKIENIFEAKRSFHRELAKISFEEKIKILFHLQEIADNIKGSLRKTQKHQRSRR